MTLAIILTSLLILLGLAGIFLPLLPGLPLIYGGLLVYAFWVGAPELSTTVLVVFGILTLIGSGLDWLGHLLGAKIGRASKRGLIGGLIGLVLGLIFAPFGLVSIILFPPIGVAVGELTSSPDRRQALKAGLGTLVGYLAVTSLKMIIATAMIIWFLRAVF